MKCVPMNMRWYVGLVGHCQCRAVHYIVAVRVCVCYGFHVDKILPKFESIFFFLDK